MPTDDIVATPELDAVAHVDRRTLVVLGIALVVVAVNLRTTVSSLPPLLSDIRHDIPLTGAEAGLLTALPVLCMAWLAPLASRLSGRVGYPVTTLVSIVLIGIGNGLRGMGGTAGALLAATLVAGAGVAVLGIVLPAVVKAAFSGLQGAATGAYTVAMMGGSAIAATFSDPLAALLGSWRESLSAWAIPAAVAAIGWLVALRLLPVQHRPRGAAARPHRLPWRSRPAWLLALYLTAQSSLAYATIAWLAPAYVERGWTAFAAGSLLGVSTLAQLVSALTLPAMADTVVEFRRLAVGTVSLTVVGTAWLWLIPMFLPWVAVIVFGLGIGAGFSLGLTRIVHYASDPQASSTLTAMVFLVSYTVAAAFPVLIGVVHDATGGFTAPFGLLVLVAVSQVFLAGRLHGAYRGTVH